FPDNVPRVGGPVGRWTYAVQNPTGRFAEPPRASRGRDPEESNTKRRGATVHRLRSRRCEDIRCIGEQIMFNPHDVAFWHNPDLQRCPLFRRSWSMSGHPQSMSTARCAIGTPNWPHMGPAVDRVVNPASGGAGSLLGAISATT